MESRSCSCYYDYPQCSYCYDSKRTTLEKNDSSRSSFIKTMTTTLQSLDTVWDPISTPSSLGGGWGVGIKTTDRWGDRPDPKHIFVVGTASTALQETMTNLNAHVSRIISEESSRQPFIIHAKEIALMWQDIIECIGDIDKFTGIIIKCTSPEEEIRANEKLLEIMLEIQAQYSAEPDRIYYILRKLLGQRWIIASYDTIYDNTPLWSIASGLGIKQAIIQIVKNSPKYQTLAQIDGPANKPLDDFLDTIDVFRTRDISPDWDRTNMSLAERWALLSLRNWVR